MNPLKLDNSNKKKKKKKKIILIHYSHRLIIFTLEIRIPTQASASPANPRSFPSSRGRIPLRDLIDPLLCNFLANPHTYTHTNPDVPIEHADRHTKPAAQQISWPSFNYLNPRMPTYHAECRHKRAFAPANRIATTPGTPIRTHVQRIRRYRYSV